MNNYIRSVIFGLLFSALLFLGSCEDESSSISLLALGDSYTIGESVDKDQRWPVLLADSLRSRNLRVEQPKIIAQTGWTTSDLQEAIEKEKPHSSYDLVSLQIGVNNQYQGLDFKLFEKEFKELLKQAVSFADGKSQNVFVVSIPNYGVTPFGQKKNPDKITRELSRYNETARKIAQKHDITFINITPISEDALNNPELTANDELHPSGEMYQQWVSKMLPSILPKLQ
ncbi:lysophospholipase [Aliifodinibius salipaludis]|uniref:Lysophospholipase n=1 Tax=Fodinibius salipaludis TaxID=2032627 RepID=A0A2A2G5N6_9BACT|nr:SGNH/GDSL hydrolase family protein [Aliifodinibius salipaludis]PAU93086.1 lysophospholipase [Aliifodinibius salipaludis]